MLPPRSVATAGRVTSRRFVSVVFFVFGFLVVVELQPLWSWTSVSRSRGDNRLFYEQRRLTFDAREAAQRTAHRFPQFLPLLSITFPFLCILFFAALLWWFFCRSKEEPEGTVSSLSRADVEAWELFMDLDQAETGSVSLKQLRTFLEQRSRGADEEKQGSEGLLGQMEPLVGGSLDESLVPGAMSPTEFILKDRAWRLASKGRSPVHSFFFDAQSTHTPA